MRTEYLVAFDCLLDIIARFGSTRCLSIYHFNDERKLLYDAISMLRLPSAPVALLTFFAEQPC